MRSSSARVLCAADADRDVVPDGTSEEPIARTLTWLDVDTNCLILDSAGHRIGFVLRVRGDRATGEFGGIDVNVGIGRPDLFVPPTAVAAIRSGEVVLSVPQARANVSP